MLGPGDAVGPLGEKGDGPFTVSGRRRGTEAVTEAPGETVERARGQRPVDRRRDGGAERRGIGDARGHPQVVLEHHELSGCGPHNVQAGQADRRHVVGEQAAHRGLVSVAGRNEALGKRAVGEGALVAVDVAEERVERTQPLREAGLEVGPLLGGDEPGDGVDGETDLAEVETGLLDMPVHGRVRLTQVVTGESGEHLPVERPGLAGCGERLVEHPGFQRVVGRSPRRPLSRVLQPSGSP